MEKLLFISEYNINQVSSGCLHLKDIYISSKELAPSDFMQVEVKYNHADAFKDFNSRMSLVRNPPAETGSESYVFKTSAHYDHAYLYGHDEDRAIVNYRTKYIAFNDAQCIKKFIFGKYSHVFIFIHEPYSLFLAEALCKCEEINLVPVLMDLPEMRNIILNVGSWVKKIIDCSFSSVLKQSRSCLTASKLGCKLLSQTYGEKFLPAYPIFRTDPKKIKKINLQNTSDIKIILAGQIYAKETLVRFLKSLDIYSTNTNKNVVFCYYGEEHGKSIINEIKSGIKFEALKVTCNDSLSHVELQREMTQNYDIGYVPFPSEPNMGNTVKFSFPSKFVSYVEAGLWPIYHGPYNSSVVDILKDVGAEFLALDDDGENIAFEKFFNSFNDINPKAHCKLKSIFTIDKLKISLRKAIFST